MSQLIEILKTQPKYRKAQIEKAWFDVAIKSYGEITTLPKDLREQIQDFPWMPMQLKKMEGSQVDATWRALLELADGELVETVLMGRESKKIDSEDDNRYTICISSQVGCPMNCAFCATGRGGFKRNLSVEEIIAEVRFWIYFVQEKFQEKISNIVIMGQGEPLLNYDNVRDALNIILANTEIGPTKITLSTVGVPQAMERLVADEYFPPVRLALSLHSALEETRKKIIPSHQPGFFDFLIEWCQKYHQRFASKSHFIGFEYIMLEGINDDDKHLKALIKLVSKLGRARVNLIPYNSHGSADIFQGTAEPRIKEWQEKLLQTGFVSTVRRSQGQDIFAACGQLKNTYQ